MAGTKSSMNYYDIAFTASVKVQQSLHGSRELYDERNDWPKGLGPNERDFIETRDSFYMATIGANGWPYLQHRGGPIGLIRIVDERTLAIPDFRGNRQYISLGHLAEDDRTALFLMDYANRRRLKLYAHTTAVSADDEPELSALVQTPGYRGLPERILKFRIVGFDWNCPQHITERYTLGDVETVTRRYRERIVELEAELSALKNTRDGV